MTEATVVSFNHTGLSNQINLLESDSSQQVHQVMKDLFEDIENSQDVAFNQQPNLEVTGGACIAHGALGESSSESSSDRDCR